MALRYRSGHASSRIITSSLEIEEPRRRARIVSIISFKWWFWVMPAAPCGTCLCRLELYQIFSDMVMWSARTHVASSPSVSPPRHRLGRWDRGSVFRPAFIVAAGPAAIGTLRVTALRLRGSTACGCPGAVWAAEAGLLHLPTDVGQLGRRHRTGKIIR